MDKPVTHVAMSPRQASAFVAMLAEYESGTLSPRQQARNLAPQSQLSYVRFINNSGESIPAWGVMRITGATVESSGARLLTVAKPNTTLQRYYLVNSGDTCASSSTGVGTFLHHAGTVLYDTANTPAYGETWGPQSATWTIKKGNTGFVILGGNTGTGATSRTIAIQDSRPQKTYFETTCSSSVGASPLTVLWSDSNPFQVGDLAEVTSSDYSKVVVLQGSNRPYLVTVVLRCRQSAPVVTVEPGLSYLSTATLRLNGVTKSTQDVYTYAEFGFIDVVHTFSKVVEASDTSYLQVVITWGTGGGGSISTTGTMQLVPLDA